MIVTGSYCKHNGHFKMHSPEFPYNSTVYIGYTYERMQKKYREDNNLKYKRIEWCIVGLETC